MKSQFKFSFLARAVSLVVYFAFFTVSHVTAQMKCDTALVRDGVDPLGYQSRRNRCEGLLDLPVAAPGIAVVNFTKGAVTYPLTQTAVIYLTRVSSLPASINVRSLPLTLSTPYQMDASLNATDSLKWEIGIVLNKIGLASSNLGVFGWTGKEDDKTFIPLRGNDKSSSDMHLVLRAARAVTEVRWRYRPYDTNDVAGSYGAYIDASPSDYAPEAPITIPLDKTFHGKYEIELLARMRGVGTVHPKYKIIVP